MTTQQIEQRKMDWHLFWGAAGVIVTLGALIIGCFKSLSADIRTVDDRLTKVDERLSKLEGAFEERGKWESRHYAANPKEK